MDCQAAETLCHIEAAKRWPAAKDRQGHSPERLNTETRFTWSRLRVQSDCLFSEERPERLQISSNNKEMLTVFIS